MKNQEVKFKNKIQKYSVIIGNNTTRLLPKMVRSICPNAKNIAVFAHLQETLYVQ